MKNGTPSRNGSHSHRHVLITGGSGFIGANLAHRLLSEGERVLIFDNLSRAGVRRNFEWLRSEHGDRVRLHVSDIRDAEAVAEAVQSADAVFHLAAQVAVTTSLEEPAADFSVNAAGTLNLLEALRALSSPPPLLFTSTNKVYGALGAVPLNVREERYEPVDAAIREHGISERQPLEFYSPYGCSKGAADQYVLDYARTFGLPAAVFRMSCIYGPHQFGTEDQGWVAHFMIRALHGDSITLYGDGRQVRDILFVEDLVNAFVAAREAIGEIRGEAFNIGGGPRHTTSLRELMEHIAEIEGERPGIEWGDWRPGDQRFYVSDTSKFEAATGWRARVGVKEGVRRLHDWLRAAHIGEPAEAAA